MYQVETPCVWVSKNSDYETPYVVMGDIQRTG